MRTLESKGFKINSAQRLDGSYARDLSVAIEGLLTGGIIIKNSQDSFLPGEQGKIGKAGTCEVTAKGGDVYEMVSMLPGEHAVYFALNEKECGKCRENGEFGQEVFLFIQPLAGEDLRD